MGNYSKFIGTIVGGVVGWAAARGFLPADFATPDVVAAATVIIAAVATYLFPANKQA